MNERYFEILISRAVPHIFGHNFRLTAQQLSLTSGRLDLLVEDHRKKKHVVEVKKGAAVISAVDQVRGYVADFARDAGIVAQGWVVANKIPEQTRLFAELHSIRTMAISFEECQTIKSSLGLSESELLGKRIERGTLFGGGVREFKKNAVTFEIAATGMPAMTANLAGRILAKPFYKLPSGLMQTVVVYRGIKLGGFNRKHKHFYISTGVVLSEKHAQELKNLGFVFKTKTQSSSTHEHTWWSVPLDAVGPSESAISFFSSVVDERLSEE